MRPDSRRSGVHGCVALIAVNERRLCKSRLAGSLGDAERLRFVRKMLLQVVDAAQSSMLISSVVVVSPERDQLPAGIPVLADAGGGLNMALSAARDHLRSLGCKSLLVLPADLPRLSAGDVTAMVRQGRRSGFALAPDDAGTGTNALYLPAASPFEFQFGEGSCSLHLAEASRVGLVPRRVELPGLGFDVDLPSDLTRLHQSPRVAVSA